MITVEQVINALSRFPKDTEVVMSKDEEGNRFSPLEGTGPGIYVPTSMYSGEVYPPDELEYFEDPEASYVVVLWPTN